ncbi:hypothetical protein PHYBOEH_009141 [Phytophthora boehmeriae]|uniref:WW domain-containing protein n=1 Tax=Phytophthora boehmeriae TaxID=109152 RepID=A0A8T1X645_9STRA|nr:hypothetical protein PHYBOEH_009141 [Phytophthora boehmeriae]
MECQDCGEVFCDACWTNVHSGGRRKLHQFRALYDYYDRRMDYGDWEFPSRWPTEIEQDEMEGWSFRTHPRRMPDEVQGPWERYIDPDTKREWFYNRETEENSYMAPEGFAFQQTSTTGSGEWIKYYDEAQGAHYFYNIRTQESTYTQPATYATPRISPSEAMAPLASVQDGWEKHIDPQSGYPYYYNRLTTESVFARPMGFTTVREDVGQIGWAKYFDASSGTYYYFNSQTNESRAERPNAFSTPRISAKEVVNAGDGGLAEFYDSITGKAYYFNAETTECRQAMMS